MNYQLENDALQVTIKSAGAEVTSIRSKEGMDYLWSGDAQYWGRHAPVLFPLVGKVLENKYRYQGEDGEVKEYVLGQHGFARDSEFKAERVAENQVDFILASNEETKTKYPYEFQLTLSYVLEDQTLKIGYTVENKDDQTMYFCIGAHPAFNCPLVEGESMEDYYIEFEEEECAKQMLISTESYIENKCKDYIIKRLPLSHAYFAAGTTLLKELKSKTVTLASTKNNYKITMDISAFPFLALWSPETGAPFVCIEPWVGHGDYEDNSLVIQEKRQFVALKAKEKVRYEHAITFQS